MTAAAALLGLLSRTAGLQRRASDEGVRGVMTLLGFACLWTFGLGVGSSFAKSLYLGWGLVMMGFLTLRQTWNFILSQKPAYGRWFDLFLGLFSIFSMPAALAAQRGLHISTTVIMLAGWLCFWLGSIAITVRRRQWTPRTLNQNRTKYWQLAQGIACMGAVLCLFVDPLAGNAVTLLGLVIFVFSQSEYRLPEFRWTMRTAGRIFGLLGLACLAFAIYSTAVRGVVLEIPGSASFAAAILIGLAAALIAVPVLGWILHKERSLAENPSLSWRQKAGASGPQRTDSENAQDLTGIALDVIRATLRIHHVGLFSAVLRNSPEPDQPPQPYYDVHPVGAAGCELLPVQFADRGVLATRLFAERRPLFREDLDFLLTDQAGETEERAWMDKLDMDVCVPIFSRDHIAGVLALGRKLSGECFYDADFTVLKSLCAQAAVVLESKRLSVDAKECSGENERLESELRSAHQDLSRTARAKSDFVSIASHELRTPLTQVTGYVDMLEEMLQNPLPDMEVAWKAVRGAKKAADRLVDIVSIMLDVYQLEAGTFTLIVKPDQLASIIHASVYRWRQAVVDRHLRLEVNGLDALPEIVVDGRRIKQVFDHLIQNAIKFTPDGGEITISGRVVNDHLPPARQSIEVVVRDTGIGIQPEDLEQIFEKFYRSSDVRLHSSGETKFAGAGPGLGLTIARGFVNAHGGTVFATSRGIHEKNSPGSAFHVILPVQSPFSQEMKGGKT
jgi:signal transduction histidine kinase